MQPLRFAAGLALTLTLAGCTGDAGERGAVAIGAEAPSYAARTIDGDSVSLALLRGRPVLLNVWATWCAPCKVEIPYLESLHEKHAADGLQVIGVSVDARGDEQTIRDFAAEFGMSYPIWRDPDERVNARFLAIGVPSTYLIDGDGVLLWKHLGIVRPTTPGLADALAQALGSSTGAGADADRR